MSRTDEVSRTDPLVLRRRLRVELRRARLNANLTQKDIAEQLNWSPSKIIRIESGAVAVTVPDLRALLDRYGVEDLQWRNLLMGWARAEQAVGLGPSHVSRPGRHWVASLPGIPRGPDLRVDIFASICG